MDADAKKTALRMIPYGLYVLTAEDADGEVGAACVNWVTQTSFDPPLVAVGVKADSGTRAVIGASKAFALNVLGKGQQDLAFKFFKPAEKQGDTISGESYQKGATGSPVLDSTPAFVECEVVEIVEHGDHHLVLGRVVEAGVRSALEGRADNATLWMQELGEKTFYGG